MPKKAPRIPDETWNQHKEAIIAAYSTNSLDQTMKYMVEVHGFAASKNQYIAKLKHWGIGKYHPGSDWAIIQSKERKRKQEGKDSDIYIHGRKYTHAQVGKEIARHVPPGREWCGSEDVMPGYITVCTPQPEKTDLSSMYHECLLRNLPCYGFSEEIQSLVLVEPQRPIAPSIDDIFVNNAIRALALARQFDSSLPQSGIHTCVHYWVSIDPNMFLPPGDLYGGHYPTSMLSTLRESTSSSILKIFLQHFVFLSANNLLSQFQFCKIIERIVDKGGADILVSICRLRSLLTSVFTRKVFHSALLSGNIYLSRKIYRCGFRLQPTDTYLRRQPWTEHLCKAVYSGNNAMVELLCRAGVRPEINDYFWEKLIKDRETGYPLIDAARNGNLKAVQLLHSKGARLNLYLARYCGTALQAAASRGHLEVAEYLVQHGADINVPSVKQIQFLGCHTNHLLIPLLTPVQIAAMEGDVSLLQYLLQHGASAIACPASAHPDFMPHHYREAVNTWRITRRYAPQDTSRVLVRTALQYGAMNGNLAIMTMLLSAGFPPDSRVALSVDDTPLQMAARFGNVDMVQLLRQWGADINAPPAFYNGRTAIQGAAESGNLEILSMLLRAGAQINAPAAPEDGMTALQAACLNGHSVIVGALIANGADWNVPPSPVGGLTPIQAAASYGDIKLVQDLITLKAEINAPATEGGITALLAAAERKSLPLLELLVQHGADVNATTNNGIWSPLAMAVYQGWLEGVRFLLERGAKFNYGSDSRAQDGLLWCKSGMKLSFLDWAFKNRAIQRAWDELPWIWYDRFCDEKTSKTAIEFLLESGANLHSCGEDGSTILQRAANCGYEETCLFLIGHGAAIDIHATKSYGTPLQEAIRWHHTKLITTLLEKGADVNALPAWKSGVTALQAAARDGLLKLAVQLLERGADVSAPAAPKNGRTAIDGAAEHGRFDMVMLLLNAYGEDADLESIRRQAAGFAEMKGHYELSDWLRGRWTE
ncbi:hypothetical protein AbraCBS73388_002974 [Aspergillus brasiliensis]|uniref:Clr5 domain-containing protein n=1 Tax=Aspergillus brasiliensis TaxID=319629 RepID=A0A9W6DTB0_9EURO|nr:hypothetical protein AbraCBS73388_002974 [Aspergillus brasiliensis]